MNCNKCKDYEYIYVCSNCHEQIYYDSEFGTAICETCAILGEKFYVISYPCPYCNSEKEDINNEI